MDTGRQDWGKRGKIGVRDWEARGGRRNAAGSGLGALRFGARSPPPLAWALLLSHTDLFVPLNIGNKVTMILQH